jgi:hypothetical protein
MGRANEESRTKSLRIGEAWEKKRRNAANEPLTKRCPPWLRMKKDRRGFEVIESKAAVVRRIFDESAAGIGAYTILHRLNREGQPHLSPGTDGWTSSYVCKLLKSRTVIGEFQPFKYLKRAPGQPRRRRPSGDPVPNYFPAIIDEELFYRVQAGLASRRGRGGRKGGKFLRNVFSGIARCAYCRSPMKFEHKGDGRGGGGYLVCDHAGRGIECVRAGWKYRDLETSVFSFVCEIDLGAIVNSEAEVGRRRALEDEATALRGKLVEVTTRTERLLELLADGNMTDVIRKKVGELETDRVRLEAELRAREGERDALDIGRASARDVKQLIEKVQATDGDEDTYKFRAMIASRLRSVVDTILVAPRGSVPMTRRAIALLENQEHPDRPLIDHMRRMIDARRYFNIAFSDGSMRAVYPHDDDPTKFTLQVTSSAEAGMIRHGPEGSEEVVFWSEKTLFGR